jgi:hypothetical protein
MILRFFLEEVFLRYAEHLTDGAIHAGRCAVAGYVGGRVGVHLTVVERFISLRNPAR